MKHFIYKTINLINNNYYIGMHSTNNLDDGYLGSGNRLINEIKKYGKENFKREILCFLSNRKELRLKEKEIVNADLIKDFKCLNLTEGGEGGAIKQSFTKKARLKAVNTAKERGTINGWKGVAASAKRNGNHFTLGMKGKFHKHSTKMLISKAQSGCKNSQFAKRVFIDPETKIRKRLLFCPDNWISIYKWNKLNKSKKFDGKRHWYNDGKKNYWLDEEKSGNLKRGRLNPGFKKNLLTTY